SVSWRDFCNKIRDTFGVKENEIREKLIAEHWIYKTNTLCGKTKYKPYKETIDRDLMIVKDVLCNDGEVRAANFFTYKGQQQLIDWFAPVVVD
ncbi:MAG: phage antirepressor KilAC domain-containing protein, partial [Selenomonadaceae bacterium]|nr:phage antirepressor KilAC domain-containing protein [Selenomonadaceae bacterium]